MSNSSFFDLTNLETYSHAHNFGLRGFIVKPPMEHNVVRRDDEPTPQTPARQCSRARVYTIREREPLPGL